MQSQDRPRTGKRLTPLALRMMPYAKHRVLLKHLAIDRSKH